MPRGSSAAALRAGSRSTTNPVRTDTDGGTDTSTTNTTNTTTNGDDSTTNGDDSTTNGVEPCACPDIEVPLDDGIFVLSDNAELWKFYPADNSFLKLGNFNCGGLTNSSLARAWAPDHS